MAKSIRSTVVFVFVLLLGALFVSYTFSGAAEPVNPPAQGDDLQQQVAGDPVPEKLEPQRAALGPVQIDPIEAPPVQANKSYSRLPAYYANVVSDGQRQRIYAIQRVYGPKLDELKAQYELLKKQRDEKIEQVLSPDQKTQIEQLKLAARAKRAKKNPQ